LWLGREMETDNLKQQVVYNICSNLEIHKFTPKILSRYVIFQINCSNLSSKVMQ
jgi:hypothetical protein